MPVWNLCTVSYAILVVVFYTHRLSPWITHPCITALQIWWSIIRSDPVAVLGAPLSLLALLLGVTIWAIIDIANRQEADARGMAEDLASITAAALQLTVYRSYLPAMSVASLFKLAGSWPAFAPTFHQVTEAMYLQVRSTITVLTGLSSGASYRFVEILIVSPNSF